MVQEKLKMPSSGGGLVRYYEDFRSKIEINPWIIIVIIVLVAITEYYLYKFY